MKKLKSGFTLIEVSLVIVLIAIIIAITTPLAVDAVIKADLNAAYESLYGALSRAQKLSRIQERGQQWLVCIDNTSKTYTIAAGSCSSPVYKETIQFASHITITSSPSVNVVFASVTGNPTNNNINSSFNFTLSSRGVSKAMGVNKSGVISKASVSDTSSTTTPSIVTNGLVLNLDGGNINSYPGLNGNGNTWFDLSGNGNNGTLVNGVGFNSNNGGALSFDGFNDYISIGTPSVLNGLQLPLTICGWANLSSSSGSRTIYGVYKNVLGGQLYSLLRVDSGVLKYYTSNSGGGFQAQGTLSPSLNSWNFYAVTVSGTLSSPTVNIYLNTSSQTFSYGALTASPDLAVDFRIGANQANPTTEAWSGSIGQVSVYNRALSASEIQQNYNATKTRFGL